MSNPIKYSTGSETLALKKGNFWIGTGDVGKGPSETTGYYNGSDVPSNGYTIYMYREGAPGDLSYHVANNDEELISFTNGLSNSGFTSIAECFNYFSTQNDKVCLNRNYEPIATDGLIFSLDASFLPSYPTSGVTWYNLGSSNSIGTLTNGVSFSGENKGSFVFDGTNDYVELNNSLSLPGEFTLTFEGLISSTNAKVVFGNNGADYIQINNVSQFGIFTQTSSAVITLSELWPTEYLSVYTITRDSDNNIKIYINARLVGSGNCGGELIIKQIGQRGNNQRFFEGYIGKVFIYNRILDYNQIVNDFIDLINNDNIVINGISFTNNWFKLANLTSVTPNVVVNPFGVQDASLFERISVELTGHAQVRQLLNLEIDTWYSVSYWIKSIELLTRSDFEFSDNPQKSIFPTNDWQFYSFELKTNSTFPVGEFIDIGSSTVGGGSVLGEKYSIYNLVIKQLT